MQFTKSKNSFDIKKSGAILIWVLFILTSIQNPVFSQERNQRSIYLEVFGPSTLVGISYDARIIPGSKWGYRTGLGYTYTQSSSFFNDYSMTQGISMPLEINYLAGKSKKHSLEVGLGVSLGVYKVKDRYTMYTTEKEDGVIIFTPAGEVEENKTQFAYFIYSNVGYRYQAKSGFLFRVGISPSFNFGDSHGIKKSPFIPYLSCGYSF